MSDQPYAVMHVAKLKSVGSISGSSAHTARDNQPANASTEKAPDNVRIIGAEGAKLAELVADKIGNNGGKKIRQSSNPAHRAVIALELLLTASPEYFRPNDPSAAGVWEPDKLEAWVEQNCEWLNEYFGSNAVLAELHLDESTPHIHAYIVPINARGHLSAKDLVGGREKLSTLQTDYAKAMEPLGLTRGIKGSKATSERIQDYYSSVNKAESSPLSREDLIAHSVDRQRQITRRKEAIQTAHTLADKIAVLERTIENQKAALTRVENAAQLGVNKGAITLAKVASDLGLVQNEVSPSRWFNDEHDIKITGDQFHDFRTAKTGSNAIDLVQQVNDNSFTQAVTFLDDNNWIGAGQAIALGAIQSMDVEAAEVSAEAGAEVEPQRHTRRNLEAFLKVSEALLAKVDEPSPKQRPPKRQSEIE
jgi:Plasmid recombination enzyme